MEASDMTDVLHFFFEEDLLISTAEEMEAKSAIRTSIYQSMYGETYKYGYKNTSRTSTAGLDGFQEEDIVPFDPTSPPKPTRPYVPTTEFDSESPLPFGKTLDAPLG